MQFRQNDREFINFLQNELALSVGDIAVALRKYEEEFGPLPMLLWQYGLVSIEQLEQIFVSSVHLCMGMAPKSKIQNPKSYDF